jgi:hypothetical protein
MTNLKSYCFFIILICSWNVANGRIVATAGYEGPYQGKDGCHKIWAIVFDMTTDSDGNNLSRMLGFGYFIQGQCQGAEYPDAADCRTLAENGITIFNKPGGKDSCITNLMSMDEAVNRTCLAASMFSAQQLKNRRVSSSSAAIEAVFDADFKVLHLKLQFPKATGSSYYTLSITNAEGVQVHAQSWGTGSESSAYSIDVQDLPKGTYHLMLSDGKTLREQISIPLG